MTLSRCKCQKVLFAAIAQNFGREGLHIMTESMHLVHEGCKSGHFTVLGADDDLWKALAIARHGATDCEMSCSTVPMHQVHGFTHNM